MENFNMHEYFVKQTIQKLLDHDVAEGLIFFNEKTKKYEFVEEIDLFGFTQEELFAGLDLE
jgi:hypothetical protein